MNTSLTPRINIIISISMICIRISIYANFQISHHPHRLTRILVMIVMMMIMDDENANVKDFCCCCCFEVNILSRWIWFWLAFFLPPKFIHIKHIGQSDPIESNQIKSYSTRLILYRLFLFPLLTLIIFFRTQFPNFSYFLSFGQLSFSSFFCRGCLAF